MLHDLGKPANTREKYPHSVKVMREVLTSSEDGSITMAFIGQLGNASDLLDSQPDEISELCGVDLVKQKVKKILIKNLFFYAKNEK